MKIITEVKYQVWSSRNQTRYENRKFIDGIVDARMAMKEIKESVTSPAAKMMFKILSITPLYTIEPRELLVYFSNNEARLMSKWHTSPNGMPFTDYVVNMFSLENQTL